MSLLLLVSLVGGLALAASQKIELPDWDNAVRFELLASQDKARPGDTLQLALVTQILPGYHIYGPKEKKPNRTELQALPSSELRFGEPVFPQGVARDLADLGRFDLYQGEVTFRIPFRVSREAPVEHPFPVQVKVNYQICTDSACSPPVARTLSLFLPAAPKGTAVRTVRPEIFARRKAS